MTLNSKVDGGVVKEHNKLRIVSEESHSLQSNHWSCIMLFGHQWLAPGECQLGVSQYQNSRCWGATAVESLPGIRISPFLFLSPSALQNAQRIILSTLN
jgi:hypothetical protein